METTTPIPAATSPIPQALLDFMQSAPWTAGHDPNEIAAALHTISLDDFNHYSPEQQARIVELNGGQFSAPSWQGMAPVNRTLSPVTASFLGRSPTYTTLPPSLQNDGFSPYQQGVTAAAPVPTVTASGAPITTNPAARFGPFPQTDTAPATAPAPNPAQRYAQQNLAAWQNHPVLGQAFPAPPTAPAQTPAPWGAGATQSPQPNSQAAPSSTPTVATIDSTPYIDPKDLHKDAFTVNQAMQTTQDPARMQAIRDYVQSMAGNIGQFHSAFAPGLGGAQSGNSTGIGSTTLGMATQ